MLCHNNTFGAYTTTMSLFLCQTNKAYLPFLLLSSIFYNGHAVIGVWTGPQLRWHTNCLQLLAILLALSRLRGHLRGKDVLVCTDNTATFAYISRQCGYASIARHNCPVTFSSGVRSIWGRFLPSTSQECSIRRPTSCLEQHFLGSGDFIPRQSSLLELVRSGSGRPVCISRNR